MLLVLCIDLPKCAGWSRQAVMNGMVSAFGGFITSGIETVCTALVPGSLMVLVILVVLVVRFPGENHSSVLVHLENKHGK